MVVLVVVFTQVMVPKFVICLNSGSSCHLLQFVLNHVLLFIVAVGLYAVSVICLLT